jgi:hypothetical protein
MVAMQSMSSSKTNRDKCNQQRTIMLLKKISIQRMAKLKEDFSRIGLNTQVKDYETTC